MCMERVFVAVIIFFALCCSIWIHFCFDVLLFFGYFLPHFTFHSKLLLCIKSFGFGDVDTVFFFFLQFIAASIEIDESNRQNERETRTMYRRRQHNTTQQNKLKWKYHYIPVNRRRATAFLVKLPSYKSLAYGLFSLANAFFSGAFFLSFFFLICVVWWWW